MISAAKIAHNPRAHASHALTRHDCALPATLRITRTSATLAPARLIACPGRPALRAWSPARLVTCAPGHLRAWSPARLDAGTLTRSPSISALRLGLLRRYAHLAALSYCELCLTARTRAVIQRIRT
ncbi:hypothetical protein [Thiolapillus sp.]|uniref:hypothetical protein n=1 Tax=Thiolapillus sp. TaxID=2017437 RepID=UPI003AF5E7B8